MNHGAQFSEDKLYRYSLWRHWDDALGAAMFIGLNPSTADEVKDDPTVRRCMGFARSWGFGGIHMLNIFAFRSTNPKALLTVADPVGRDNNAFLQTYALRSKIIIAAWGNHGALLNRGEAVADSFSVMGKLCKIGPTTTKAGHPKHPLYLKGLLEPSWFGDNTGK